MNAELPPDVRDRAAQRAQSTWLTRPSDGWRAVVDAAMPDPYLGLVDQVIAASGGQAWLDGPTNEAVHARFVVTALRASIEARFTEGLSR